MTNEERYNQTIESIKIIYDQADSYGRELMEKEFPELRESEDEMIRKEIIQSIKDNMCVIHKDKCLAWLEKQSEQKPTDEVKPKFNVGDWITNGEYTWKVTDIKPLDYILQSPNGDVVDDTISYVDEHFHLWTIQDAKDGDILMANAPFIFNGNLEGGIGCPGAHCGINTLGKFQIPEHSEHWTGHTTTPSTKEQHDLLFKKMHEAGYEWDAEKKELKKIEQKPSWSEEDEKMCQETIDWFEKKCFPYALESENPARESIKWLKSLRPQSHWKPSGKQMSVLQIAIKDYGICAEKNVLELLYNDLKNL